MIEMNMLEPCLNVPQRQVILPCPLCKHSIEDQGSKLRLAYNGYGVYCEKCNLFGPTASNVEDAVWWWNFIGAK
mgnify:CR=1 FL=1